MAYDAHSNFGYSTVLTAPAPALTGTSLTVQAGQGALFPAAPFNCTVWPADVQPLASNAEIVRVTVVVGDVLTITRAQEGTAAVAIAAGYQIANTASVKVFTDLEAAIAAAGTVTSVDMSVPGGFLAVSGNPIVNAGTLTIDLDNQAANEVFCGPSAGPANAPAFRALVEGDIPSITESKLNLSDVTTADTSITEHGFAPKLSNVATEYLDGTGAWSVPAGGGGTGNWDAVITKSADQSVVNSTVLANDSELLYALAVNSVYMIELQLLYSATNLANDYKGQFSYPNINGVLSPIGWVTVHNLAGTPAVTAHSGNDTNWPGAAGAIPMGTFIVNAFHNAFIRFTLTTLGNAGNLQWTFASQAAGGGDSITKAGSTLFIKKLA